MLFHSSPTSDQLQFSPYLLWRKNVIRINNEDHLKKNTLILKQYCAYWFYSQKALYYYFFSFIMVTGVKAIIYSTCPLRWTIFLWETVPGLSERFEVDGLIVVKASGQLWRTLLGSGGMLPQKIFLFRQSEMMFSALSRPCARCWCTTDIVLGWSVYFK